MEPSAPLPSWITEDELATYGGLYEKSGFQMALQVPYRCLSYSSVGVSEKLRSTGMQFLVIENSTGSDISLSSQVFVLYILEREDKTKGPDRKSVV